MLLAGADQGIYHCFLFSSSTHTQAREGWINIPTRLSAEKIVSRFSARFFVGSELSMTPFYEAGLVDF